MCACVRVYVLCLGVLCGHGVEPKTSVCTEKGQEKGGGVVVVASSRDIKHI